MKPMRNIFHIVALLTIVLLVALSVNTWGKSPALAQLKPTPPPSPTPGLPVPKLMEVENGAPIVTVNEAIKLALFYDSLWTSRKLPLTDNDVASDPDMIVVEKYATRQEAANVYGWGVFGDPEVASEPVWVVIIKGRVQMKTFGLASASGRVEADGVTFCFSQKTGNLRTVLAGIAKKQDIP